MINKYLSLPYICNFAFCIYLMLGPIYVFPSGLPQLSDVFAFASVSLFFFHFFLVGQVQFDKETNRVFLYLFLFFFTVVAVSIFNGLFWKSFEPLIFVLYYVYNILVFAFLVVHLGGYVVQSGNVYFFTKRIKLFVVLSIFSQVAFSFFLTSKGSRPTLFFNNPNQLGYYSLAILCTYELLFIILEDSTSVRTRVERMIVYFSCTYLAFLSLSKAAIVSVLILIVGRFWQNKWVWITGAVFYFYADRTLVEFSLLSKVVHRMSNINTDDSFVGRGYDRIVNHADQILWGVGEGLYERFDSELYGMELHSSWGTLLFSYGILGFSCFLLFLMSILKNAESRIIITISPVFLYSFTHQGLRFTYFWIVLAVAAVAVIKLKSKKVHY